MINPDEGTERILPSTSIRMEGDGYEWIAGIYAASVRNDSIKEGDILFIIDRGRMYAVWITRLFDAFKYEDKLSYKFAVVSSSGDLPTKVNLGKLNWKSHTATEEIPYADRTLHFITDMEIVNNQLTGRSFISIEYDDFYGCYGGPPNYPDCPIAAHIAIVDKEYIAENNIVDLTKFRFKTWDDGLGNRCE